MLSLFRLLRPAHWIKNGFVLVGLLFGRAIFKPEFVVAAIFAFIAFSLMASFVYIINDLSDIDADRLHPVKRNRPVTSGAVSALQAKVLAAFLLSVALPVAWLASPIVFAIVMGYGAMNLAYSFGLKDIVVLDVFIIATGFMLRILAGTVGIGIEPSKWLIVCGLMVTLFLGFTKRRAELVQAGNNKRRRVLEHYSVDLLDKFIGIMASATIITYSLYTVAPETVKQHNTDKLIYTSPVVMYGLFRYLYLLYQRKQGEDPVTDLFHDRQILLTLLTWGLITTALLL
ncbi:MAG: decaprenyl-phosphate phosphoribosyltransferase [Pseudomonadota bacterium]